MSNPLESVERSRAEGMLLGYIEVVCTSMSLDEYESSRRELSGHLFELASAYEELDLSPVEAMRTAIAKLGPPRPLGDAIRAEDPRDFRVPCYWRPLMAGCVASAVAMSLADLLVCQLGLVGPTGGAVFGFIAVGMGLAAATFVVLSRWTLLSKALICGLLYGPGLVALLSLMNGRSRGYEFGIAYSILFGLAGVATVFAAAANTARSKVTGPAAST